MRVQLDAAVGGDTRTKGSFANAPKAPPEARNRLFTSGSASSERGCDPSRHQGAPRRSLRGVVKSDLRLDFRAGGEILIVAG
jgi:hypothetical protein